MHVGTHTCTHSHTHTLADQCYSKFLPPVLVYLPAAICFISLFQTDKLIFKDINIFWWNYFRPLNQGYICRSPLACPVMGTIIKTLHFNLVQSSLKRTVRLMPTFLYGSSNRCAAISGIFFESSILSKSGNSILRRSNQFQHHVLPWGICSSLQA